MTTAVLAAPSREQLVHALYEAAELEHNLMCTYLYAAFSLKSGAEEGLTPAQDEAVSRWRSAIMDVAIEEMGHLAAVWNITAALGGAPRFGRDNFPLNVGLLPAGIVVKLAPFNAETLQHFIHLERPEGSIEREGAGFESARAFRRGVATARVTPMPQDYETVGEFYHWLGQGLRAFAAEHGEAAAFCGDPALQLSPEEVDLGGAKPVLCLKTALAAFDAIVAQGEGASADTANSHYQRFLAIRTEFEAMRAADPAFTPAFPAAHNPVLRPPPKPEGRVWLENEEAAETVDLANAAYGLMLRLLAYSYGVARPSAEKAAAVDLGIALMRTATLLGERAARLPAGKSNPDCNAGMSFVSLRDAAALAPGAAARAFFIERFAELARAGAQLAASGDARVKDAARLFETLAQRAARCFDLKDEAVRAAHTAKAPQAAATESVMVDGFEVVEADDIVVRFSAKRCIHARFCVTKAPTVFLANVEGPWIHPETMAAEELSAVSRECPSGAIQYHRKDGHADEAAPPVNLASVREGGPYALRAPLLINGEAIGYRATLCRCGASKNKPYCDGSHHEVNFAATGEPPTGQKTDMLPMRDGPLEVNPQPDGPLMVRGNLEIISGTGRMVARVTACRLCRCGGSATKPFCDGTHAKIGFKS
jgi:CDGSH-type Zn-finger protein/uncharacterized Fe-S cluster protein YjdI